MSPGITAWIRLAVLSGVAAVVLAFLGWQAGQILVSAGPPPAPIPWVLPPQPTEDPARDLAILTARRPWTNAFLATDGGASKPAAASTSQSAAWRLAGIGQRPGDSFVLILIGQPGAAKLEYGRVGDSLPDGSTLVQITADSAITKPAGSSGEQRVHRLFRGKSQ